MLFLTVNIAALHLSIASDPSRLVWRCAMAIASLAVLPFAFGPIIPIAHFIFESTSRPMLWVTQSIVALMNAALTWRIVARLRSGFDARLYRLFAGVLVGQIIWLGSSIRVSDNEQGVTTPDVWDSPVYILDWLAAIGMCILLSIAAWQAAQSGTFLRLLIGGYLLVVVFLAVGTVG
ncbi:hypothetical protein [Mesorhizobium sp. CAU 1741]|uniref:hypothetical protein n=1 Tax=Mesorhizobium sp. CAU 1741 TaxID=3140366 RepID=UPI00325AE57C